MTTIVGAGLAGLIAAQAFPNSRIVESSPQPQESHKALLRFRSDAVARVTGIEFKPVTVHKAIWHEGREAAPTPRLSNLYSQKCLAGRVADRSIWNLEPVTRWIAPEDFYDRLVESLSGRIEWGTEFNFAANTKPVVSTAPLSVVGRSLGRKMPPLEFEPITVARYRIPYCDVHQTVYFPSHDHSLYRASITGDLLIAEFTGEPRGFWIEEIEDAFGLVSLGDYLGIVEQKFGKIAPIDDDVRRALVGELTTKHNIYSLGRFATWRNILLDDVVNDVGVIKKLMRSDGYAQRIQAAT